MPQHSRLRIQKAYNHAIHTADDTVADSGAFTQAAAFAKLGLAYIAHFGGIAQ